MARGDPRIWRNLQVSDEPAATALRFCKIAVLVFPAKTRLQLRTLAKRAEVTKVALFLGKTGDFAERFRFFRDAEVACSNHVAPTFKPLPYKDLRQGLSETISLKGKSRFFYPDFVRLSIIAAQ